MVKRSEKGDRTKWSLSLKIVDLNRPYSCWAQLLHQETAPRLFSFLVAVGRCKETTTEAGEGCPRTDFPPPQLSLPLGPHEGKLLRYLGDPAQESWGGKR